jgi:hypothetical protein
MTYHLSDTVPPYAFFGARQTSLPNAKTGLKLFLFPKNLSYLTASLAGMQASQKKAVGFEQRIARGPDGISIQIMKL